MISWELSKLTLTDMSHYLWDANRYQPSHSWLETLTDYTEDTELALALQALLGIMAIVICTGTFLLKWKKLYWLRMYQRYQLG